MFGLRSWVEQDPLFFGITRYFDDGGEGDSSSNNDSANEGDPGGSPGGSGGPDQGDPSSDYTDAMSNYGTTGGLAGSTMGGVSGLGSGYSGGIDSWGTEGYDENMGGLNSPWSGVTNNIGNITGNTLSGLGMDWGPNESFMSGLDDARGWQAGISNWGANNQGWNAAIGAGLGLANPFAGAAWSAFNGLANNSWGQVASALGGAGWGSLGGLVGGLAGNMAQGNGIGNSLSGLASYGLNSTGNGLGQAMAGLGNTDLASSALGMAGNYAQNAALGSLTNGLDGIMSGPNQGYTGDPSTAGYSGSLASALDNITSYAPETANLTSALSSTRKGMNQYGYVG